ncbi:CoA ester lyase [Corynebacterium sp. 319]|uniref:HpcH/HpaI aldolase/citrate lyase family protein n=1 Tax=unclassified Corynebacterium TaxID=2624378 RepID=UPI00125CAE83|nr:MULTISPECIES: CoA ester lyase [unclassified Corynebacterium]KAB1552778.1 CoA ester lyase [Corynebacterium sp. 321]KAB1554004.1 CoA ester lyase [Corynebacterium sp. 319]KAB3540253.1 CoA ester lyase [Corynebacterium sp. 366]
MDTPHAPRTWIPAGPALLFAPADRPDRFAKAEQRSDMVIVDLEDGCRAENRTDARRTITESSLNPATTIVRINPPESDEFAEDVEAVARSPFTQVMIPKAEDLTAVDLPEQWDVIALIETPRGVLNAAEIAAHPQVVALFWGAEDLTAALGGTSSRYGRDEVPTPGGGVSGHPGGYREVPRLTRSLVLLHAAAAGIVALDSIHADTTDSTGAYAEAVDAAASGFAATVSIHPGLVPAIRKAYSPTEEQVDWARRVEEGARSNSGAFAVDGKMIDLPLRRQAQVILARAQATHPSH